MATITITFPDAQAVRVRDALCDYGGWSAESGMTKADFSRDVVRRLVRDAVRAIERDQRIAAAPADPDIT